jgi:membrane-bound lytic murein transglycosylase D
MRKTGTAVAALGLTIFFTGCQTPESATSPVSIAPQATAPVVEAAPVSTAAAQKLSASAADQHKRIVQIVIQQVEATWARGEAAYRKGHLLEAKKEFDRAVDLMLESSVEIRTDPQLEEEFNRIVDQVNGLEMQALKEGNGFVPKEEPTPAEAAEAVTFVVDPALVAKARADLATTKSDLPLVVNDYVASFINFFANTKKGHYTLLHSLQRGGRYKAMIERVMAEEGVPQDLIYLAVAESGFNPRAQNSHSHAGGMWQFMPYGNYGLERNSYVDERFDPEKSTRAYARYMKFNYNQLGDWYLAMAAYDHGAGNIQREVQRTGYADFWELYRRHELPVETQNYVPQILAAIIIANNPQKYGLDDLVFDPPILTDTVTINYSLDLRLASDVVGAPVSELEALNPSLLRRVTPPDTAFDLHLPAGTATLFEQRIATVPEAKRNAWRYRRVAADDTLVSMAHDNHISVADLAAANNLKVDDSLKGVEALAIPSAPAVVSIARTQQTYTARKGDTLVTIADRFGVSLTQLRQWNKISGIKVAPGRKLRVSEPVSAPRSARGRKHSKASADDDQATKPASAAEKKHTGSSKKNTRSKSKSSAKSTAHAESKSPAHKSSGSKKHSSKKEK